MAAVTFIARSGFLFVKVFSVALLIQAVWTTPSDRIQPSANVEEAVRAFSSAALEKRDVYLLGFDSLVDRRGFSRYFESEAPWDQYLSSEGFRTVDGVQSPGENTKATYTRILDLSETPNHHRSIYTTPYAVFELAKSLHYRTQFLFHNNHFGRGVSPYWDYHYPSSSIGVCPFVPRTFGLYLCRDVIEESVERVLQIDDDLMTFASELKDRIRVAGSDDDRWLTIAHTWTPNHTDDDYRHSDKTARDAFRADYRAGAARAVGYMRQFITTIKKHDPAAVIVVFGDHGPWLSRGWEVDTDVKALFTEHEMQSDRRDVTFYVYPDDFCRGTIGDGYQMHTVVRDAFDCLAKSEKDSGSSESLVDGAMVPAINRDRADIRRNP